MHNHQERQVWDLNQQEFVQKIESEQQWSW